MTRERSPGGRRDLDQSKAQRTARPMVPGRSRSSKHVRIPPLSAAFPHGSARTKKQLVARGGSRTKRKPFRQRRVCRCAGGTVLRDAQAKLAPPPAAAAFSTHSSFGAAMPRRRGALRRHGGSLTSAALQRNRCPTSMQRASCALAPGLLIGHIGEGRGNTYY